MPQNTGISPNCFDSLGVYRVMWVATGGGDAGTGAGVD